PPPPRPPLFPYTTLFRSRARTGPRRRASMADWNTVIKTRLGFRLTPGLKICAAVLALMAAAACASAPRSNVPAGTTEPDKFLFEIGRASCRERACGVVGR